MAERDYSHRDIVDKLGIKAGHAVAFDTAAGLIDPDLRRRCGARAGRDADPGEELDIVLAAVDRANDAVSLLTAWRPRLRPTGGIWLLSPKRGHLGYIDQRELIGAGLAAGLVDNNVCSVSEPTRAMRFVIPRADRRPLR